MKKFVSSVIYSLIMTFLSVAIIFLLQSPLMTFVYYGFFSENNSMTFNTNIINKVINTDAQTIVIMIIQVVLTLGFIFALFMFIKKIINIFLKEEKLVKPYYLIFFFMTSIVPVVFVFLSIFLKVKLVIMIIVVQLVFTVLNILIIIFTRKILPDTADQEYRKYLFTKGAEND